MHEPFGDWRGYSDFVDFLVSTNSIVEHTQLWWSVRPHHDFGTVEFRTDPGGTRVDYTLDVEGVVPVPRAVLALVVRGMATGLARGATRQLRRAQG